MSTGHFAVFIGFISIAILLAAGAFGGVVLLCWALGATTAGAYAIGMLWVGAAAIVLGVIASRGIVVPIRHMHFEHELATTPRAMPAHDDRLQGCSIVALFFLVGALSLACGALIRLSGG